MSETNTRAAGPWSPRARNRVLLAAALLAVIVALSLAPGQDRPHTGLPGQIEHLVAYTGAALLITAGLRARARLAWLAVLVAMAAGLEYAQLYIPGRTSQVIDWVASSTGAALGCAAAALLGGLLRRLGPSPD